MKIGYNKLLISSIAMHAKMSTKTKEEKNVVPFPAVNVGALVLHSVF